MVTKSIIALVMITGAIVAGQWTADPAKAEVKFEVKGPLGKVHGSFKGLQSTIIFDPTDFAAGQIEASIDASTVSTGVALRNKHLREKSEWFDVKKYPRISFRSTEIEKKGEGFVAKGELTMKGVTKAVEIPFTFKPSGNAGEFDGTLTINRAEFNVGDKGGSVGETIDITLEIPVTKKG